MDYEDFTDTVLTDFLCTPAAACNCNASNQVLISDISSQNIRSEEKLSYCLLGCSDLHRPVVAHNFLDECIPVLASALELGHDARAAGRLYS